MFIKVKKKNLTEAYLSIRLSIKLMIWSGKGYGQKVKFPTHCFDPEWSLELPKLLQITVSLKCRKYIKSDQIEIYGIFTLCIFTAVTLTKIVIQPWWIPPPACRRCNSASCPLSGHSIVPCWQGNLSCHGGCWLSGTFPLNQRPGHCDQFWRTICVYWFIAVLCFICDLYLRSDQSQRYANQVNRQDLAACLRQGSWLVLMDGRNELDQYVELIIVQNCENYTIKFFSRDALWGFQSDISVSWHLVCELYENIILAIKKLLLLLLTVVLAVVVRVVAVWSQCIIVIISIISRVIVSYRVLDYYCAALVGSGHIPV